nr:hypothetical protein [uncultured Holophaga sp.]
MPRRGRPRKPVVDPSTLETLTIPEAMAYCRKLGRSMSRPKLMGAVLRKDLAAYEDHLHHDRNGHPLLVFYRKDLEAWLTRELKPFQPKRVSTLISA